MQFKNKTLVKFLAAASMFALSSAAMASALQHEQSEVLKPSGKGFPIVDIEATKAAHAGNMQIERTSSNAITYHGGPVMVANNTNVYYIWYGSWSSAAKSVLVNFMSTLGGTPIFNVNTSYYNGSKVHVKNVVTLAGQANDNYSLGNSLGDADIATIVSNAIGSGALPLDTNASYMVLTAQDVNETSGFGSQYCGWHDHTTISGKDIKYAFVGDPTQIAPSGCGVNSPSPNGNGGADAMTSVIFHELSETVTDPDISAWYDRSGNENGDKCAWNFGTTFTTSNGATANQTFGGRHYLLQQMWLNVGSGSCVQKY
ncbi:MAG: hypothetical protein JO218_07465 [Burkholderiales bacterium]|nr:hypothetical protein [Burkholderiales bacterium]